MLDTINNFIITLRDTLNERGYEIDLNYYKSLSWIVICTVIVFFVGMYLLLSFGLKRKMKDNFMEKSYLAFVPIYQFVLMSKITKSEKVMSMKKNQFMLLMICTICAIFLLDIISDLVYYNKIFKLLFKNHQNGDYGIDAYVYEKDVNVLIYLLGGMLNLLNTVLFVFFIFDYLRYNIKSPLGTTIACVIFGFLFPILVFTTRKNPVLDYKSNFYARGNENVQNANRQNTSYNGENKGEEPFSDFSNKKEQPFSEFQNEKDTTYRQNTEDFYTNNSNKNDNDESSDDDMFN